MVDNATFTVEGVTVPVVWLKDFRFQDWALIRDVTGLDAESFVRNHNDDRDVEPDPLVLYGYAAVSYWRAHPLIGRERMAIEASGWTSSMVQLFIPETEEGGDAGPPEVTGVGSDAGSILAPSSISDGLSRSADGESALMNQTDFGDPGSAIGSLVSHPR